MKLANFIYHCPVTDIKVQGTLRMGDYEGQRYVTQHCPACRSVHLVDPITGATPLPATDRLSPAKSEKS